MLAELSNASTESTAFSFIPVSSGAGEVLGILLGGALAFPAERFPALFGENDFLKEFPYVSSEGI